MLASTKNFESILVLIILGVFWAIGHRWLRWISIALLLFDMLWLFWSRALVDIVNTKTRVNDWPHMRVYEVSALDKKNMSYKC